MGVGNEALQVEQTYFPLELLVDDPDEDELEQDLEEELLMLHDPDPDILEAF